MFVCNVFLHQWETGEVLNNDDKPVTENMLFGHWHGIKYCPIICHILGLPCEWCIYSAFSSFNMEFLLRNLTLKKRKTSISILLSISILVTEIYNRIFILRLHE